MVKCYVVNVLKTMTKSIFFFVEEADWQSCIASCIMHHASEQRCPHRHGEETAGVVSTAIGEYNSGLFDSRSKAICRFRPRFYESYN